MKKLLFGVFAIAGLVACVQEDVLNAPNLSKEIAFGGYVDSAVRSGDPSTTKNTLDHFTVWAYVDNSTGNILTNELVTKSGDAWTYSNVQYWVNKHDYRFFAISPYGNGVGNVELDAEESLVDPYLNGLGKIKFTNVEGTEDVLYASNNEDTENAIPSNVTFAFDHILSKVKFTFKNGFTTENNTVVVKDIKMVVPNNATVVLNGHDDYTWENHAGETTLSFGHAGEAARIAIQNTASSDYERLTIPAGNQQEYKVTFTAELYAGDVLLATYDKETTLKGWSLEPGKSYNFVAALNHENISEEGEDLLPIVFDANVDEWDAQSDYNGGDFASNMVAVSTAEELKAALAKGDASITLLNDITVPADEVYTIAATATRAEEVPNNVNLYLNGKTLKASSTKTGKNYNLFDVRGTLNVENGTIEYTHTGENMVWSNSTNVFNVTAGGVLNLNGVTAKNLGGSDMGFVVHLNNWGEVTLNVENSTLESNYVAVRAFNSGNDMNNVTINNSTLQGGSYAFWVHNYTLADFGNDADKTAAHQALLNFDIFNGTNTFIGKNESPVRYGFTNSLYYTADGILAGENAESLAAALTADVENIHVALTADIDCPITSLGSQTAGSGEYKLGGENTKTITIDLNEHKLNITTTYWSAIGANNADALFTIKNGTMTSTGNSAGTWNAWDVRLSNCNYVIEDVVFEKEVALDNVGKSATLKNVTINGTGDKYALWITAEGQTVTLDGLTVVTTGRGVKIDEQYIDAPAKVTLNVANTIFKTEEKAAILVKSVAGAEINVENIDITAVAADTNFAVWVDEDSAAYANLVVVNGASKTIEGQGAVASDNTALQEALAGVATSIKLTAGEYTLPKVSGKSVTITGSSDVVVTINTPACYGTDLTFEGVTVVGSGYATGVQHVNTVTYNNVTIKGDMCLYGVKNVFNNCTFELENEYIWVYASENTEFNNCVFNTTGKAILVYNEGAGACNVKVAGCTFNATAGAKAGAIANQNCAAIEIDNFQSSGTGAAHAVTTSNNTYSENFSGEWRIKSYTAGNAVTVNGGEYTSIAIDGKTMTIDANKNVTVNE